MPSAELIAAVAVEPESVVCQSFARGRCRGFGAGQGFRTRCSLVGRRMRLDADEVVAGSDVVQQELSAAITMRAH